MERAALWSATGGVCHLGLLCPWGACAAVGPLVRCVKEWLDPLEVAGRHLVSRSEILLVLVPATVSLDIVPQDGFEVLPVLGAGPDGYDLLVEGRGVWRQFGDVLRGRSGFRFRQQAGQWKDQPAAHRTEADRLVRCRRYRSDYGNRRGFSYLNNPTLGVGVSLPMDLPGWRRRPLGGGIGGRSFRG